MNQVVIRNSAKDDLKAISAYTREQWGPRKRTIYLSKIDDVIQRVAANPKTGLSRDDIRKDYRSVKAGRHVLFYRETKDGIEIMRILHESMDLLRRL